MTDEELVHKIKNGEKDGISSLYDRYSRLLLGVIMRITGDKETAEDVLQDVIVKVWDNINQYDEKKSKFYTWLMNVGRNTALDKTKTHHFKYSDKIQSFNPVVHNEREAQKSEAKIPDDLIDLQDHVAKLDKEYREVLDLVYFNGYTQNEAAKTLNLPLGTVKTRIRKGLKAMRALYQ